MEQEYRKPRRDDDIVITGLAGKFPEAKDVYELRDNLYAGKDMVTVDDRRWDVKHPEIPERAGKLDDIDKFDAGFFGVHHRQATTMDPMVRIILEKSIEALFDAGVHPKELEGTNTGVFVGSSFSETEKTWFIDNLQPQHYSITGCTRSMIANRVSYHLKLKGLSHNSDTACSSSLFALEHAYRALKNGECDRALVAGINLCLHPYVTLQFARLGVLSHEGKCKVFDVGGNGYVRSEAAGVIFLQKHKEARRVYSHLIHAKTNCDGFKPQSINFPSKELQTALLKGFYAEAGVDPAELSYLEAHGTATFVGDPEEVASIDEVFVKNRKTHLLVGSVKSNVGHSEPSSGFSSVTKAIISMENGLIPPNLHYTKPREGVQPLELGRLKVVTENTKFEDDRGLIGVSSFGFGGANSHVLLHWNDKVKIDKGQPNDDLPRLVCASGRVEQSVPKILNDVKSRKLDAEFVRLLHQLFSSDIEGHFWRGYSVLAKSGEVTRSQSWYSGHKKPLCVSFNDLEEGWSDIVRDLGGLPPFAASIQRIQNILSSHNVKEKNGAPFNKILGNLIVQIALVDTFKAINLQPDYLVGNGLGEFICGYYENCLSLEETVLCSYHVATSISDLTTTKIANGHGENGHLGLNGNKSKLLQKLEQTISKPKSIHERWLSHQNEKVATPKYFVDAVSEATVHRTPYDAKKTTVLSIGEADNRDTTTDRISFNPSHKQNNLVKLLEVLGTLYKQGHDLAIHELYPKVHFPVSRGTPMISPLIQWEHDKSWFVPRFKPKDGLMSGERTIEIDILEDQWTYVTGHVIEERNLFPATGYLNLVWETLAMKTGRVAADTPVVFENCKFHRATNISKDKSVQLTVTIQTGSGNFEVTEKEAQLVTGRVFVPKNLDTECELGIPTPAVQDDNVPTLKTKDVYKELRLRGYNYKGDFKKIHEVNSLVTQGTIEWNDNWVTFMDNMLQMKILQIDTRLLFVPTAIQRLSINPKKHIGFAQQFSSDEAKYLPVHLFEEINTIKSGGIEIRGLKASSIAKKRILEEPVLEKYEFVPNQVELSVQDSVRVNLQIALENHPQIKVKVVETVEDEEPLGGVIHQVLSDMPLIQPDVTLLTKKQFDLANVKVVNKALEAETDCNVIVGSNLLTRDEALKKSLNSLKENGYIISREGPSVQNNNPQITILTIHKVSPKENLVMLKRLDFNQAQDTASVEITPDDHFAWLPTLQATLAQKDNNVVIYAQGQPLTGILGLVNCIRKEPGGNKAKCYFLDDSSPTFDLINPLYRDQLQKNLAVNVLRGAKWGTYRHLLLDHSREIKVEHCYVNNTVRGDLTSLQYIEGPLHSDAKVDETQELVYNYYSAMNFRDVMIASGRINKDVISMDRTIQECVQGFEYSGRTRSGKRVMGMVFSGAMATMTAADRYMMWTIPDKWSMEQAATVPCVYATLIYSLFMRSNLRPGNSILIHSGTGGIGLAGITLALHHGCKVFTTVGTQDKRDYLKQKFQLMDNVIGNSRDCSFEQMIYKETQGRGVDFVVNSLAEEKLLASVRCLAQGGTFLEIGKFDLASDNPLQLELIQRQASFKGIMLDGIFISSPPVKKELRRLVREGIENGSIQPLPTTVFKENNWEAAFRFMMTGKHMGKVLLKIRDEEPQRNLDKPSYKLVTGLPRYYCDPERVQIILGGLGGFGLELADWLVLKGARKVVLTSRQGITKGYQAYRIKIWRSYGATVDISTADCTTATGCEALITEATKLGPIESIFNLAVVLKDSILENQTEETFRTSFGPKADATRHLDEITRRLCPDLRTFVVFSSVSCGRGNGGQTNYGMSNSVMERVCEKRRRDGYPAVAVQWGAVGDVGIVADMQEEESEMEIGGTLTQRITSCLDVLDLLLKQDHPIVSSMVVAKKNLGGTGGDLVTTVAQILGIKDLKTISLHAALSELGMDSMTAVEIRQTLERDFQVLLSPQDVRTITFAKLIELQEAMQSESESATLERKEEDIRGFNMFIREVVSEGDLNNPAIKMQTKNSSSGTNVILFTGLEGMVTTMEPLAKSMGVSATCIQYNFNKLRDSVQDLALDCLPSVKELLTKSKPFHIASYSFGTIVALEIVHLLEKEGYKGHLLLIDGAPVMIKEILKKQFESDNPAVFETNYICQAMSLYMSQDIISKNKERMVQCATFKQRLEIALEVTPKDSPNSRDLLTKVAMAIYHRLVAAKNYVPTYKIRSDVTLIKPTVEGLPGLPEDFKLSEICSGTVTVRTFQGNHVTILRNPEVGDCVTSWAMSEVK